jgi:hypothetical protein
MHEDLRNMVLDVEDMQEDLRILSSGFDAGAGAGARAGAGAGAGGGMSGKSEGEGRAYGEGEGVLPKEAPSKGVRPGDRSGKEMVQDMCDRVKQLMQTVAAKVPGGEAVVEKALALGSGVGGGEKTLNIMELAARKCVFLFTHHNSNSILCPYRDVCSSMTYPTRTLTRTLILSLPFHFLVQIGYLIYRDVLAAERCAARAEPTCSQCQGCV